MKSGLFKPKLTASASFDLTEAQQNPNIRLVHAQFVVEVDKLEDSNGRKFLIEDKLKKRGLPIFVFEDTDAESMVQDEGERVKDAFANTK